MLNVKERLYLFVLSYLTLQPDKNKIIFLINISKYLMRKCDTLAIKAAASASPFSQQRLYLGYTNWKLSLINRMLYLLA